MSNEVDIKALEKAFNNDLDLVLFFLTWVKNGKNGVKAYQELHPNTDYGTAATLASRLLKKVDIAAVLEVYGAGFETYFKQLSEGHQAMRWNDFTGEREPDHKVRGEYNKRIGKLLGVEKEDGGLNIYGEKVIAILGGKTVDVSNNNSNEENTRA